MAARQAARAPAAAVLGRVALAAMLAASAAMAAAASPPSPSPSPAGDLPAEMDARLAALPLDIDQVSVYVRRVDADRPLLAVNADVPRTPASVIKLLTTIAALDRLGPVHRWQTEVRYVGSVGDGRLDGDLYIKGYGDPYLTAEAYARMIRAIRAKGIRAIGGNLVFDDSLLLPTDADRGDFDGAAQAAYNALPAALSLNRQVTDVHVYLDRQSGQVGAYTEPPLTAVDLINEAKAVTAPCKGRYHRVSVRYAEPEGARPRLTVSGSFASECPDETVPRLVLSPEQHAASAFDALWRQLGGDIEGRVLLGTLPEDSTLLHSEQSLPLAEIVRTVNKQSDNLMARMLFMELGIAEEGPPGELSKSRAALAAWLADNGFAFAELVIDNGSGLSRETRISAASLGELLTWAYHQPWMPELVASLPIMGVDGTLATRMRGEPLEGRAHMKTGTLRNASCIAGYLLDARGERWVVVVLVNAIADERLQAWHGHAVHHDVLRWVYDGAELPPAEPESPPPIRRAEPDPTPRTAPLTRSRSGTPGDGPAS